MWSVPVVIFLMVDWLVVLLEWLISMNSMVDGVLMEVVWSNIVSMVVVVVQLWVRFVVSLVPHMGLLVVVLVVVHDWCIVVLIVVFPVMMEVMVIVLIIVMLVMVLMMVIIVVVVVLNNVVSWVV